MSTKTSFKRIALVAAASLAIGGFTAVSPATAASGDLTGKVVATTGTALNAATAAAASVTSAAAPLSVTAIAGSTVKFTLDADTAGADLTAAAAYSDATFATNSTDWTTEAIGTDCENGTHDGAAARVDCVMPVVDGTYYLKLTKVTHAYVKLTVVNLAAITADGFSWSAGSATSAVNALAAVNGVAGPANTVTLKGLSNAAGGKAGLVTVSGSGATITSGGTVATGGLTSSLPAGTLAQTSIVVATPTVGTVTASYFEESAAGSGIFGATAAATVTITVNATAQTNVYNAAKSTAYVNTGDNAGTLSSDTTHAAGITADATLSTTAERGTITVTQNDASGNALTSGFKAVSATITGGGLLGTASDTPTGAAVSSSAAATTNIKIFSNGTAGAAVVTVSVDGVAVKTLKVTFYGPVASLTATVKKNYLQASTNAIADVIFVDAKDAQGNLVANTPTITSATTGVALTGACAASDPTTTPATPAKCTVTTGATTGSAVLTITASGVTTVKTTATVNVSKSVAAAVKLSTDKASYAPGEKITLTLSATDADGKPLATGSYDIIEGASTTTTSLVGTAFTDAAFTITDGVATTSYFAPMISGPVTFGATLVAAGVVAAAIADSAITITTEVEGDATASLALDAANAATDAANNAYDEAQNATQAASDALAAVTALAAQVKSLIASVKKLTAAVAKLKK